MQLIQITSQPVKWQCRTEAARLEMQVPKNPQGKVNRVPDQMNIQTKDIAVRLDTTQMRSSLNLKSIKEWKQVFAQEGMQASYTAIGEAVQTGNQMQNIQDGVTIAQIVQQKMLRSADFSTYTTFLPSAGVDTSWDPAQVDVDYQRGSVETEWEVQRNVMTYVPSQFHFEILQKPKVTIEYLGTPTYVPPSSAPDYTEE